MLFCSLGKLTHVKAIVRDVSKVLIPKIVYLKALMRKKRPGTIANNRVSAYVYDGWCWRLSFTSVFFLVVLVGLFLKYLAIIIFSLGFKFAIVK